VGASAGYLTGSITFTSLSATHVTGSLSLTLGYDAGMASGGTLTGTFSAGLCP